MSDSSSFAFIDDACSLEPVKSDAGYQNEDDYQKAVTEEEQKIADLAAAAREKMAKIELLLGNNDRGLASPTDTAELLGSITDNISAIHADVEKSKAKAEAANSKLRALIVRRTSKTQEVQAIMRKVAQAAHVDLAFVVDATSSMKKHIIAVKQSINSMVDEIRKTNSDLKLRTAVVVYRDLDIKKTVEVLDFVEDIQTFKAFLRDVRIAAGNFIPESMATGIQQANKLSWEQVTRVVFIVADAPCHGSEFHNFVDNYPHGTPGIDIKHELETLMANSGDGTMSVCFGRITPKTDKMIGRFNECGIGLDVVDFIDRSAMTKSVKRSVRNSIFKTILATTGQAQSSMLEPATSKSKKVKLLKSYQVSPLRPSDDEWVPTVNVKIYRNVPIKSVEDLQAPLAYGILSYFIRQAKTNQVKESTMRLRIAKAPFAEGSSRIAYHGKLATYKYDLGLKKSAMILKTFKHHGEGINSINSYLRQTEVSAVAHFLANQYNKSHLRPTHCAAIHVLETCVVEENEFVNEEGGNRRFCAEEPLPVGASEFTKYSNNTGHWNMERLDESLLLFVEFTFLVSGQYLLVSDLQGVKKGGKFYLTDPAILCKDVLRFGATNLGDGAMEKSIETTRSLLTNQGRKEEMSP